MEHILNPPFNREVFTMKCFSFLRGSTWRTAMYIARNCCSVGVYWVAVPFPSWGPNPNPTNIFPFGFFCHSAQPISQGITDTPDSNGSPAWKMPRVLIGFVNIFVFSKVTCCADPQSHVSLLRGGIRNRGTLPGGQLQPSKPPKPLQRLTSLSFS